MSRSAEVNPARRAGALESWRKRRRAAFNEAIAILTAPQSVDKLPQLQHAAHVVSETLALHIPSGDGILPRGYQLDKNGWGDPGLALNGVIFNPVHTSPAPTWPLLERFGEDLRTGLVREITEWTGAVLDFNRFSTFEEIKR